MALQVKIRQANRQTYMHITILMVLTYIACCVRIGTAPWKYFQLNARHFSGERGIFSKMAIDDLIPERWRLSQTIDADSVVPDSFPVFLKPEWGRMPTASIAPTRAGS